MPSLARAADQGAVSDVESILNSSNPDQADLDLALARACCSGHLDVARLLVEHGADPNGQYRTPEGNFDYGPVILASCEFLCVAGVQFLLEQGANPNGNIPDSGHFQACTPLEMVDQTYQQDDEARQKCRDLLAAAGAQ